MTTPETRLLILSMRRMDLVNECEKLRLGSLAKGLYAIIMLAHTRRGPVCVRCALLRLNVAQFWLAPIERNAAEVVWMRAAYSMLLGAGPEIHGQDEVARDFAVS